MDSCWLGGFWLGLSFSTSILCLAIYKRILQPLLSRRLPRKPRPPPIPQETLHELLQLERNTPPEPAHWFNHTLQWLFKQIKDTPAYSDALFYGLAESAVDLRRRPTGIFLSEVELEGFLAGNSLPRVTSFRVVADGKGDHLPLTLSAEVEYDGGLGGVVRVESILGVQVWLLGRLKSLKGRMFVVIGEGAYHVGFGELRDVRVEGRAVVAGREWGWLNWFLGTVWFPMRLRRKYLMPKMKGRWLIDKPPHPPYPWDDSVKAECSVGW